MFLGMAIASFAGFGFIGATLVLAGSAGFVNALVFAARPGFAISLAFIFADSLSFVSGFAFTDRSGFFSIFALAYVSCLANTLTFADNFVLAALTIAVIAGTTICRRPIAATKLIGRRTCEMRRHCGDVSCRRNAVFVGKSVIHHLNH